MIPITFYTAFLATVLSITSLSWIAVKEFDKRQPRTLSELAAAQEHLLNHFRRTLFICGTLFAVTVYGYLVPRISSSELLAATWTLTYVGNILAAVIPARDKTIKYHYLSAQAMAVGMLLMAYTFAISLTGVYGEIEVYISVAMSLLGIMTFVDKSRFIVYELLFIFMSHISILVAALALL
jgi:hypothetical protein